MLLEIKNLEITFSNNQFKAVDNISFSLNKGEILGIVGESGSGKTLTSLSLLRLLPSQASLSNSEIIFSPDNEKTDLLKLDSKEIQTIRGQEIAMIFQEPMTALNPSMRCGKQVEEMFRFRKSLKKNERLTQVYKLFEKVRLSNPEEVYKKFPHQLSGGQRQRVMIAMAIACNPKILIADEPTTALDVSVQKSILDLLVELRNVYGLSIIIISHDLGMISSIADNIIVMRNGKLIEKGSAKEIINNPKQPYTKALISCRPGINKRPTKLSTIEDYNKGENDVTEQTLAERQDLHQKLYNQKPVLTIKNLNAFFRKAGKGLFNSAKTQILHDISLDIYPGEVVGLVGESGSGKTTLGRVLMNLIDNADGEIIYKGMPLNFTSSILKNEMRKKIQYVFQDPYSSLTPHIKAGDAIIEVLRHYDICNNEPELKEKANQLLCDVGLNSSYFSCYPHEMSGGERQRLVIARSLAVNPEMLILDEAVASLDVSVQAQVLNLLNDLKKKFKLTYLFISHDLAVVRYMSDRIVVLNNGRIIETGEADALCNKPTQEYTIQLLSDSGLK